VSDETGVRRDLLTRMLFDTLAQADQPRPAKDVLAEVESRTNLSPVERSRNNSGVPRWDTYLRWVSTWASTIGWMTKRGGWAITEAGIAALGELPEGRLYSELTRRYRQANKRRKASKARLDTPYEGRLPEALALVEPGWWTTIGELSAHTGLSEHEIDDLLENYPIENAHRILEPDGLVPGLFATPDPVAPDIRRRLEREGLEFDESGHPSQNQFMTASDLDDRVSGDGYETATQRAWLVRGSSVEGRDLVPVWLHKESVSLAATRLREIDIPLPRDELKSIVDDDYHDKSYAAREAKLTEFDAFCNRMWPDDYVITTSQGKAYVGVIRGDATYVVSSDQRSNLRRDVEWLNPTNAVPFAHLPAPLPARLASQSDVVELTENLGAIETLLEQLGIADRVAEPDVKRELQFPPVSQAAADEVFCEREWLQQQADLRWDRRQLIFYGPPGTGKTFLARKLAAQLADPSAVKLVQFHPSYTYEDFFEGFRPVQRTDGALTFELRPGPFRQLVEAARQHPADPYILIIDEINRANLAKVFGELYFLLEYRNDAIGLLYSAESDFTLPPNVFVIGTMNTTDRSIALVDAAMRRRFAFVQLHPDLAPTNGLLDAWLERIDGAQHNLDAPRVLKALNESIDEHDLAIGPSYFMHAQIYRQPDGLARVWETSIMPLLEEHHYGSPPEIMQRYRLETLRAEIAEAQPESAE